MRGPLRTALILIISVGLLLLLADRVAAHYAERQVADRVAAKLASQGVSSADPEVSVTGFPFLTQVAGGNYAQIQVVLRDLKVGGVPLPQLTVHAHDVRAPLAGLLDGSADAVATTVTGVGLIPYAQLLNATGLDGLSVTGSGSELRLRGELAGAGTVTGTAEVTLADGVVRVRVTELTAAAGGQVASELGRRLSVSVPVPELPFRLTLTGVSATQTGLEITATASEVTLT